MSNRNPLLEDPETAKIAVQAAYMRGHDEGVAEGRRQALEVVRNEPEPGDPSDEEAAEIRSLPFEKLVTIVNATVRATKDKIADGIEALTGAPPGEPTTRESRKP